MTAYEQLQREIDDIYADYETRKQKIMAEMAVVEAEREALWQEYERVWIKEYGT